VSLDSVYLLIDSFIVTCWCGTEIQNSAVAISEPIELGLMILLFVCDITLCDVSKLVTVYDCQFSCVLNVTAAQTLLQHVSANQCSATFRLYYKNYRLYSG